jgi:hypothetical protein
MSQHECLRFLIEVSRHPAMLVAYESRTLPQLLFQAKNDGYSFDGDDLAAVRGAMEANVILNIHHDPFDGTARLWRSMWGKDHLRYLVEGVIALHTEEQL